MFASTDKVHKLFIKALEAHTPHDWRYLGESFRLSLWDEAMIERMRSFVVGFSVADSQSRGLYNTSIDDRMES